MSKKPDINIHRKGERIYASLSNKHSIPVTTYKNTFQHEQNKGLGEAGNQITLYRGTPKVIDWGSAAPGDCFEIKSLDGTETYAEYTKPVHKDVSQDSSLTR